MRFMATNNQNEVLAALDKVLAERRAASAETSYVASLYHRGLNKILEKIGEEATEVVLAAKDNQDGTNAEAVVAEIADLWFHSMVLLAQQGLGPEAVLAELERRFGLSGLEEKANRGK